MDYNIRSDVPNYFDFLDVDNLPKFTKETVLGSYPFQMPDGSPIGYSFPGDKGIKVRAGDRFFDYKYSYKHWKKETLDRFSSAPKFYPKLHFWKNKRWQTQWIVIVDFDNLLQSEYRQIARWGNAQMQHKGFKHLEFKLGVKTGLIHKYQEEIGQHGIVFQSPKSNRPKIALLIEYSEPVKAPFQSDIILLFEKLFPEHMAEKCIDLSRVAMSTTYINWEQKELFAEAIPHLIPIQVERKTKEVTFKTTQDLIKAEPTYKYFVRERLPAELEEYICVKGFRGFLCCLATMSGLARNGFGISQKILARTLKLKQSTCSRYIRLAIELGLLEVVNDQYIPEKRAKTYKAKGALLSYLKKTLKERTNFKVKLPKKVKEGQWHSTIVQVASTTFRTNLKGFIEWFKSLPGWDIGDRLYQAQRFVKYLISKHPELASTG